MPKGLKEAYAKGKKITKQAAKGAWLGTQIGAAMMGPATKDVRDFGRGTALRIKGSKQGDMMSSAITHANKIGKDMIKQHLGYFESHVELGKKIRKKLKGGMM